MLLKGVLLVAVVAAFAPSRRSAGWPSYKPCLGPSRVVARPAVDIQFGETSGAALVVDDVAVRRGPVELLTGINWRVMPGERWGIVGPNGAGKSTLLGAILGVFPTAEGRVSVLAGAEVGYLEQTGVGGSARSVRDEVMSRMGPLAEAQMALARATAIVEGGDYSEAALEALSAAQEAFEDAGGYSSEETVSKVLAGLGFDVSRDLERPCSDFSGGWQMRIALARLLLSAPDLLLLDEPTNHLDAAARTWLASYLAGYEGTLILVSHDTAMLKVVCESIAEVVGEQPRADRPEGTGRSLELYKSCSFEKWRSERTERAARWVNEYDRQQAEAADLEDFIRRFGAKASKASQAKDRERKLDRLRKDMVPRPPDQIVALAATVQEERDRLVRLTRDSKAAFLLGDVKHEAAGSPLLSARGGARLKLATPPPCGENVLALKKASVGYSPGKVVVRDADVQLTRGMRLIVRGPNGAGKSTLVKALAGALPLLEGDRVADARLKLSHFTQDLSQELDPEATALALVLQSARRDADEMTPEEKARAVLGALGLRGEMALRKVGTLSGGEKARVALAIFVLTPCNVYILDEPSNHLDVDTVAALAAALNAYEGVIVVVSHDKAFVNELKPTHVLTVNEGTAKLEARDLDDGDWVIASVTNVGLAHDDDDGDDNNTNGSPEIIVANPAAKKESDDVRRRRHNKPKLISKLEAKIAEKEARLAQLDADLAKHGADMDRAMALVAQREPLKVQVEDLYAEYQDLEAL